MAVRLFKNKHLVMVPMVMIAAVGLVGALAWKAMEPVNKKNGFNRTFISTLPLPVKVATERGLDFHDFIGATSNHIFFRTKILDKVVMTDLNLNIIKYLTIPTIYEKKSVGKSTCVLDSPFISIFSETSKIFVTGKLYDKYQTYKFPTFSYSRIVSIGNNSYIFRGFDSSLKTIDQIFLKGSPQFGIHVRNNKLLELRNDAGISTDGTLSYDTATHSVTYVLSYINDILILDTNLLLKNNFHTIDTVTTPLHKTEILKTSNALTTRNPNFRVNGKSDVSNGKLFINSKLKSDNDINNQFDTNYTIDVYSIRSGQYLYSFFIAPYKNQHAITFRVLDKHILILYEDYISLCNLQ